MANGRANGGSRTIGYIVVGGVILLLLLAWLLGFFGGDDDVAEVGNEAVVTEDGVATGEDAEEAADD